jgi:ribonucleoside-diphosphate reductase alpha chain
VTFQPQGLGLEIFQSRHAAHSQETWGEGCSRVATHVSNAETGGARTVWRATFEAALLDNLLMPGGRIWYGSGRARGQLLNCFVIPTADSREGWGRTVSDTIIISGTGGGVGVNFSPTRPRNSLIRGTGGMATGAVSEMEMVNGVGNVIKAGGGRRVALMFALGLGHGDILEFMNKKLDRNELNNANVSVVFDDDPELFFQLVRDDGVWPLKHNGQYVGEVSARALWGRLVENAVKPREGQGGGEPGLLNGYLANRMSNIWYIEPLVCTNPCGEIWMSPYDCCCLASLVLPRFVKSGKMQWDLLRDTVATGVRFLDDVLTVNIYPLPEIAEKCTQLRRIGLGVTGLHHLLLELGLGYASPSGLEFVDKLMGFIKHASYEASTELAAEKGTFPAFRAEQYLQSKFIKTLKPSVRAKIAAHGIRNCALNTIAPVGTGSMVCDVSSAIEPIFAVAYERRFRRGDELATEVVIDPMFARFEAEGKDTSHFLGAHELSIRDHLEMQRTCQRHIDNAVSKTINLPGDTSPEELSALYMEYLPELKGVTVYPDGSRKDQPLTPLSRDAALNHLANAALRTVSSSSCRSGSCDL